MGDYTTKEDEEFKKLGDAAVKAERKMIMIFEDADGNWRGGMTKFGKIVYAREVGPETVLQALLTHDGQK